jgi:hypothetical protein
MYKSRACGLQRIGIETIKLYKLTADWFQLEHNHTLSYFMNSKSIYLYLCFIYSQFRIFCLPLWYVKKLRIYETIILPDVSR